MVTRAIAITTGALPSGARAPSAAARRPQRIQRQRRRGAGAQQHSSQHQDPSQPSLMACARSAEAADYARHRWRNRAARPPPRPDRARSTSMFARAARAIRGQALHVAPADRAPAASSGWTPPARVCRSPPRWFSCWSPVVGDLADRVQRRVQTALQFLDRLVRRCPTSLRRTGPTWPSGCPPAAADPRSSFSASPRRLCSVAVALSAKFAQRQLAELFPRPLQRGRPGRNFRQRGDIGVQDRRRRGIEIQVDLRLAGDKALHVQFGPQAPRDQVRQIDGVAGPCCAPGARLWRQP